MSAVQIRFVDSFGTTKTCDRELRAKQMTSEAGQVAAEGTDFDSHAEAHPSATLGVGRMFPGGRDVVLEESEIRPLRKRPVPSASVHVRTTDQGIWVCCERPARAHELQAGHQNDVLVREGVPIPPEALHGVEATKRAEGALVVSLLRAARCALVEGKCPTVPARCERKGTHMLRGRRTAEAGVADALRECAGVARLRAALEFVPSSPYQKSPLQPGVPRN